MSGEKNGWYAKAGYLIPRKDGTGPGSALCEMRGMEVCVAFRCIRPAAGIGQLAGVNYYIDGQSQDNG